MSFAQTAALGALAGFTIYLGLPFGRLQLLGNRTRVALAMFAVGVLAFIFVDVMEHAFGIVEAAVEAFKSDGGSFGHAAALAATFGGGGHYRAAGAELTLPLEEAETKVLAEARRRMAELAWTPAF